MQHPHKVLAQVAAFLGIPALKAERLPRASCWHDCAVPLAPYSVDSGTHSLLDEFFAEPTQLLVQQLEGAAARGFRILPGDLLWHTGGHTGGLQVNQGAFSREPDKVLKSYIQQLQPERPSQAQSANATSNAQLANATSSGRQGAKVALKQKGLLEPLPAPRAAPVIPLLSVSLTADPKRYLARLLNSIDTQIGRILVLIGNEDSAVLDQLDAQAKGISNQFVGENLEIIRVDHNPGCAAGWNMGMRAVQDSDQVPWAVIVNNDIAFHPGSLQSLATEMNNRIENDKDFGMGFLDLIKEARWSGFAPTRQLVARVGLFDENFYPVRTP